MAWRLSVARFIFFFFFIAWMPASSRRVETTTIRSFDGTLLRARVVDGLPRNTTSKKRSVSPALAVIYITSWATPSVEYVVPMLEDSDRVRGAVAYAARGFYASGGTVSFAGPDDLRDASAAIDWALNRWRQEETSTRQEETDVLRVALCGVSYGAGIALLAAARDARVSRVVAFSPWASLYRDLNWHESPSRVWARLLLVTGQMTGRLDPTIWRMWRNVETHRNLTAVRAWLRGREPSEERTVRNLTHVPILMLSDLDDGLMLSQHALQFWRRLPCRKKKLVFGYGTHAQAEIKGLFGFDGRDGPWRMAREWLAFALDDAPGTEHSVTFLRVEGSSAGGTTSVTRLEFDAWPPSRDDWVRVDFFLVVQQNFCTLTTSFFTGEPPRATKDDDDDDTGNFEEIVVSLKYGRAPPVLTSGAIPIVSDILKARTAAPLTDLALARVVFVSDPLPRATVVLGVPSLSDLAVVPRQSSFQLYAYLYAVEPPPSTLATLITHVPYTAWNVTQGARHLLPPLQFTAAAFHLPARHRLALGFNMKNALYTPAIGENDAAVDLVLPSARGRDDASAAAAETAALQRGHEDPSATAGAARAFPRLMVPLLLSTQTQQ